MSINRARKRKQRRAIALAKVADGTLAVREMVWDGHDGLASCPIHRLLEAAPSLGPQGTRKILERANVYALLPLGSLDDIQKERILNELPRRVQ